MSNPFDTMTLKSLIAVSSTIALHTVMKQKFETCCLITSLKS